MQRCHPDFAEAICGEGLVCLCEVCTLPCDQQSACEGFRAAECVASDAGICGVGAPSRCDVPCAVDGDCASLSSAARCEQGLCRADTNAGGSGGANGCPRNEVSGNQVLVIGDTFFAQSHEITAYLEEEARNAGVLSPGERYRDNSSSLGNSLALAGNGILDQYTAGSAEAEVKVVIMNGGGADVLVGSCDVPDSDCPVLVAATAAAQDLLARMAEDGVLHIVYAFYPDPVNPSVRERMDALRPLIQGVCEGSPIPCHWLDLRSSFAGRYDEYIQPDGLNPTSAGSQVSASEIWAVMQQHCIAQ